MKLRLDPLPLPYLWDLSQSFANHKPEIWTGCPNYPVNNPYSPTTPIGSYPVPVTEYYLIVLNSNHSTEGAFLALETIVNGESKHLSHLGKGMTRGEQVKGLEWLFQQWL